MSTIHTCAYNSQLKLNSRDSCVCHHDIFILHSASPLLPNHRHLFFSESCMKIYHTGSLYSKIYFDFCTPPYSISITQIQNALCRMKTKPKVFWLNYSFHILVFSRYILSIFISWPFAILYSISTFCQYFLDLFCKIFFLFNCCLAFSGSIPAQLLPIFLYIFQDKY